MKVLIAGGAGYIGSTVASICLDNGITPVVLDNLSTGCSGFVRDRIFYRGDIGDDVIVKTIFHDHPEIGITVHCAGALAAPESVRQPLRYYRENVAKSLAFLEAVVHAGCDRLIFSSSAAVYQPARDFGVDETTPVGPATPYGWSKVMLERILHDCCRGRLLRGVALRYQNVIGADPRLRTGPAPHGSARVLDHLLDAAATGVPFAVAGTDWPTRDGTAVRDYVHVWDLARAHLLALRRFDALTSEVATDGYLPLDLGTGVGTTVNELVRTAEAVLGRPVPVVGAPRRPGDTAGCFAGSALARRHLGWRPRLSLDAAVRDLLRWRAAAVTVACAPPRTAGGSRSSSP